MLTLHAPLPGSCAPANDPDWQPAVRELGAHEIGRFELHLLRLSPGCRRMRFSSPVPDDYIRAYVRSVGGTRSAILGCFINGWLRGAAELRSREAERRHLGTRQKHGAEGHGEPTLVERDDD